ncbi:hypothetical protein ABKA04_005134 [Annulohypoxylon sp. FPYF3050]
MDPISALSLAANIAQFVDMGVSVVRNTQEIVVGGATISTLHLASLANDIQNIGTSMASKRQASSFDTLSQEEKDLCDLAAKCVETAKELQQCLNNIQVSANRRKRWDSVLTAIKTIWTAEKIKMINQRLSDYRSQLSLRVLLALNRSRERHDEALSALRAEIIEVIAVTYQDLKAAVSKEHSETAAAIFTTQDGGSIALANPGAESMFSERLASRSATKTSVTYSSHFEALTAHGVADYKTKILDSLHSRGITERQSSIPEAHKDTFEWVWNDPVDNPDTAKWDSLSQWLQASATPTGGCYWLSGKAGSGKSSLMKYLHNDQRTVRRLKDWAGAAELVVPSFYFWAILDYDYKI